MARIICVTGGKGGVGKTTTVSNLGAALTKLGKDVTVVDTNLTTPNLSIHLGVPLYPITLHDVLKNKAYITEAMYIHSSGLRIIPASLSLDDLKGTDPDKLSKHLEDLTGSTDLIFLDSAAGLGNETIAAIKASHDLLLVSNPDLPSVTDALKTKKLADEMGVNVLGAVITRFKQSKHQMGDKEIEEMLEIPILAKIPEDKNVHAAINRKNPIVLDRPNSPASRAYRRLAANMIGSESEDPYVSGFFSRLKSMLIGSFVN